GAEPADAPGHPGGAAAAVHVGLAGDWLTRGRRGRGGRAAPQRGELLHRTAAPGPDGGRGLGRARPGRPRSRGGAARRTRGARPADRTAPAHRRGRRDPGPRFPRRPPGQPRGGAGVTGAVAAIALSGGRASRLDGQAKARPRVAGRAMTDSVTAAAAAVADTAV